MAPSPDWNRLAALHAAAFATGPRAWTAEELQALAASPHGLLATDDPVDPRGFALMRVVADEAELLTIAVAPDQRRRGVGSHLLAIAMAEADRRGAERIFLEVGHRNLAARALYQKHGFVIAGLRPAYYGGDPPEDAFILVRSR